MSAHTFGQILALLSATSFAFGNIFIARAADAGGDRGVSLSVLVTMVMSFAAWVVTENAGIPAGSPDALIKGLLLFAAAGAAAMVVGRSLVFKSIQVVGVIRASALKRLNPFFSAILAFAFLHEMLAPQGVAGMALLAAGFVLMIVHTLRRKGAAGPEHIPASAHMWGVTAAGFYALAYLCRKLGLGAIAAPAFGTFVSAATGLVGFGLLATFLPRYRRGLLTMFSALNRWTLGAALAISAGQILMFSALFYERVSVVVMISALEIFLSAFLAVAIYKTEARPDASTMLSAGLATIGVILVALA